MKNVKTKLILALLCLSFLIQTMVIAPAADIGAQAVEEDLFYCRGALAKLNNSTALLYAYDRLVEGVATSAESIQVWDGTNPLTQAELEIVFDAYRRDHAEQFWLGNSYRISQNKQSVISVSFDYLMSGETLENAKARFEQVLSATVAQLEGMSDEYEIEKYLHDRLAVGVTYVEGANAHNAYGALVEGKAVCEGYAEALQCLLHRAGIQSLIVLGSSINPGTGLPENHAWNMVRINGKYYHTDLTWNDQEKTLYYAYFNQTDAVIREDHTISKTAYELPACTDTEANYFVKNGSVIGTNYTVDSIAGMLKTNNFSIHVFSTGDPAALIQWFVDNIRAIAQRAGVTESFVYGYSQMGRELTLYIDTCQHRGLTYVEAKPVSCTSDGNIAYYACRCGKWFLDVAAKNEIQNHQSVKILALGHAWTVKTVDSAHLREAAADCRGVDTYWLECSECHALSDTQYFESTNHGPHKYGTEWEVKDKAGHRHKCTYCDAPGEMQAHIPGAPATETAPQTCTECGYELAPALTAHVHQLDAVDPVDAACGKAGKKGYYVCSCGQAFEDADATLAIPSVDTWGNLPALQHKDADEDGACDLCSKSMGGINLDLPISQETLLYVAVGAGAVLLLIIFIAIVFKRR